MTGVKFQPLRKLSKNYFRVAVEISQNRNSIVLTKYSITNIPEWKAQSKSTTTSTILRTLKMIILVLLYP